MPGWLPGVSSLCWPKEKAASRTTVAEWTSPAAHVAQASPEASSLFSLIPARFRVSESSYYC